MILSDLSTCFVLVLNLFLGLNLVFARNLIRGLSFFLCCSSSARAASSSRLFLFALFLAFNSFMDIPCPGGLRLLGPRCPSPSLPFVFLTTAPGGFGPLHSFSWHLMGLDIPLDGSARKISPHFPHVLFAIAEPRQTFS